MSDVSNITVAGITFTSDQVVSATVKIDGREVYIGKKDDDKKPIGFADCVSGTPVEEGYMDHPGDIAPAPPGAGEAGGGE